MVDFEIISRKNGKMGFIMKNANPKIANAIRRAIISELPALAIEEVYFTENSSSLYDEIIAHRIGLIPIKAKREAIEAMNFKESCSCSGKGCANCEVNFQLEKNGPCVVYSHDLKSDSNDFEAVKGIPIIKLGESQRISLIAKAILGNARKHAKWQSAIASYSYYPVIEINENCIACEECVKACPRNVFDVVRKKDKEEIKAARILDCILCKACVEACEYNAIAVEGDDTKFIFFVESLNSADPKEVFLAACKIIKNKAKELEALI